MIKHEGQKYIKNDGTIADYGDPEIRIGRLSGNRIDRYWFVGRTSLCLDEKSGFAI